ncbi:MAG: sporulation protein YqfD [Ruminococcaceae bacterium]|nr:sporulation protein YqfD [Oscillospiraceae bacterium]
MLTKITNRLRGEVRLRVVSAFPERVLNLCASRRLALWDVCWVTPTEFACTLSWQDCRELRRAAEKLDCSLTVEQRRGMPFFLRWLKGRRALAVGIAASALGLLLGSFFIWDFEIEGNVTVSDREILRALEKNGVRMGSFGLSVDGDDLRNHVLLDLPQLSWIAVNVTGCRAHVQVRERVEAPGIVDRREPSNLVARRAGLVLEIRTLAGERMVLPGTTVEEGQLLISGIEDTDTFGARMLAGLGSVTARTWYTLTTEVPLTGRRKAYGEETVRWALVFGTHRVNFYGNSSIADGKYDKIQKRTQLRFLGISLPVSTVREVWRPYTEEAVTLTAAEARQKGEAILTEYLHTLVDDYGTVQSSLCTAREADDVLRVTLTAECREEIGRQVPIYDQTVMDAEA